MKSKVQLTFYCYIDEEGMQKHILPPNSLDVEEKPEEKDDQEELDLVANEGTSEETDNKAKSFEANFPAEDTPDTEIPVTADGTPVEDAIKKALSNLMGHLDQPLRLSGTNNGIWSNKKIDGDVEMCKDEAHDLLNAEADGLRAVFVLTLMDKK